MVVFLYTEGIQLIAAHSGGRYSDLTQEVSVLVSFVKYCNLFVNWRKTKFDNKNNEKEKTSNYPLFNHECLTFYNNNVLIYIYDKYIFIVWFTSKHSVFFLLINVIECERWWLQELELIALCTWQRASFWIRWRGGSVMVWGFCWVFRGVVWVRGCGFE